MTQVFADSFYWFALVNPNDAAHSRAVALTRSLHATIITTYWILVEVADSLSSPANRGLLAELFESILTDPSITVLPPTVDAFEACRALFVARADKDWSLTDCISFATMNELDLDAALTADRHYIQAGLKALLI